MGLDFAVLKALVGRRDVTRLASYRTDVLKYCFNTSERDPVKLTDFLRSVKDNRFGSAFFASYGRPQCRNDRHSDGCPDPEVRYAEHLVDWLSQQDTELALYAAYKQQLWDRAAELYMDVPSHVQAVAIADIAENDGSEACHNIAQLTQHVESGGLDMRTAFSVAVKARDLDLAIIFAKRTSTDNLSFSDIDRFLDESLDAGYLYKYTLALFKTLLPKFRTSEKIRKFTHFLFTGCTISLGREKFSNFLNIVVHELRALIQSSQLRLPERRGVWIQCQYLQAILNEDLQELLNIYRRNKRDFFMHLDLAGRLKFATRRPSFAIDTRTDHRNSYNFRYLIYMAWLHSGDLDKLRKAYTLSDDDRAGMTLAFWEYLQTRATTLSVTELDVQFLELWLEHMLGHQKPTRLHLLYNRHIGESAYQQLVSMCHEDNDPDAAVLRPNLRTFVVVFCSADKDFEHELHKDISSLPRYLEFSIRLAFRDRIRVCLDLLPVFSIHTRPLYRHISLLDFWQGIRMYRACAEETRKAFASFSWETVTVKETGVVCVITVSLPRNTAYLQHEVKDELQLMSFDQARQDFLCSNYQQTSFDLIMAVNSGHRHLALWLLERMDLNQFDTLLNGELGEGLLCVVLCGDEPLHMLRITLGYGIASMMASWCEREQESCLFEMAVKSTKATAVLQLLFEAKICTNRCLHNLKSRLQKDGEVCAARRDYVSQLVSTPLSLTTLCRVCVDRCLGCRPGRKDRLLSLGLPFELQSLLHVG